MVSATGPSRFSIRSSDEADLTEWDLCGGGDGRGLSARNA
jgi:hypothetical protein